MARALPPSASVAQSTDGAKLFAPSAARNAGVLVSLLQDHAPPQGTALEIASGTGQHVTGFAAALPGLHWHPTEIDPARRASIDAYIAEAGLPNVAPAQSLDAAVPGWAGQHHPKDLVLLVNLLHLIPAEDTQNTLSETARVLSPQGRFIVYGPFKRSGTLISAGDQKFDAELRSADPAIGYKDDRDMMRWLNDAGLSRIKTVEMPANNLALIARKP